MHVGFAADPAFEVLVRERQLFLNNVRTAKNENPIRNLRQPDQKGVVTRPVPRHLPRIRPALCFLRPLRLRDRAKSPSSDCLTQIGRSLGGWSIVIDLFQIRCRY